jgi:hypothetical protein
MSICVTVNERTDFIGSPKKEVKIQTEKEEERGERQKKEPDRDRRKQRSGKRQRKREREDRQDNRLRRGMASRAWFLYIFSRFYINIVVPPPRP